MRLDKLAVPELLALNVEIIEELRTRSIVRSSNNPVGDYAEYLFCRAFGWKQAPNSEKGFDAVDDDVIRYQIKSRRPHKRNKSRQLSALRKLEQNPFDVLAGVLFEEDFGVMRAALIPISTVRNQSNFIEHTNSYRFILRDEIWDMPGVSDVTKTLREVSA